MIEYEVVVFVVLFFVKVKLQIPVVEEFEFDDVSVGTTGAVVFKVG